MSIVFEKNRTSHYLLWFGCLAMGAALVVYAYLGIFSRYMADDYCLLLNMQSGNIFTASWNKYLFESNRFSNLFVLGFWELFPGNIAFVPTLHVVLWVIGLYWLLSELNKLFGLKLPIPVLLLVAETLALFSFFTTPNVFQILYWRPGQVSYLTPIVFFTLFAAWLVNLVRMKKVTLPLAILFGFFAFFIGGLSETVGALHISILSLSIFCVILFDKSPRRTPALTLLSALLIGALLALVVMFLAPANALRINDENGSPTLTAALLRAFEFAFLFLRISFTTLPIPFLGLLAISSLMTMLFMQNQPNVKFEPRVYWLFLLIPLLLYGLVFASFAPSAYGQSYPVERVRFPAHFMLTITLTAFGICAGYVLSYIRFLNFMRYAVMTLAFVSLLYPFWMMRQPLATYEFRRLFALRWDEREQMIYEMKAAGQTELVLPALDGYEGTKELDVRPYFWVNQCAARIYGVDLISAISVEEEDVLNYFSE
ncbi:MAG: hypothetical protein J0M11_13555 [Anaerolineae bacterium]|nr:hypothetical protein [Anaerolineae bacterium]